MDISEPGLRAVLVARGAGAGAWVLFKLVMWARGGGRGAILAGALFGLGFVADPVFERLLRTVQEAREDQDEEADSGEPPDPRSP